MYYNIASRLIDPTLHSGFDEVSAVCKEIIQAQYAAAGKPLSQVVAVDADFSQDRLDGLVDYISSKESYSEAEADFLEKLVTFHQDVHSQTVEKNFRNLGQMGFTPKLVRKNSGGCCEWCLGLAGPYDYDPGMDREVFRSTRTVDEQSSIFRMVPEAVTRMRTPKNGILRAKETVLKIWGSIRKAIKSQSRSRQSVRFMTSRSRVIRRSRQLHVDP